MGAPARLLGGPLDWDELARELGTARLLVAMRYHAVACAAMAGCPVVPVAYEPKVESLARALGVPYVTVDDPDVERRLAELTRSALERPADHTPDPARIAALADRAATGLARVLA
jgi:polysaccharide pyruvyl transferase WcaK-like protein